MLVLENFLQFVIKHQHQRTANTSPEIGQVTLEESSYAFSFKNFASTINSSMIFPFGWSLPALHHQSPSNGVKRIGQCF